MALDRFVYWRGRIPKKEEIQTLLEDFIGGAGVVSLDKDRFFINLVGRKSYPLKRQAGISISRQKLWVDDEQDRKERWIEVFIAKDSIDIITREQDDLTNCLADGLRDICIRFFRAETEEGRLRRLGI